MSPAQNTNIPLVLVGNSLSVLIAATVRAEKGLKTVIVNPGGHLGGYFAGIQALGRLQDAGMVLYELSSLRHDASVPPLESYNPMGRNDVGRFSEVVRRYVSSLHDIHTVPQPMMWADGKMLPDMILSNGISALPMLSNASTIRDELIRICRTITPESRLWHPANKGAWPLMVLRRQTGHRRLQEMRDSTATLSPDAFMVKRFMNVFSAHFPDRS